MTMPCRGIVIRSDWQRPSGVHLYIITAIYIVFITSQLTLRATDSPYSEEHKMCRT